MIVITFSRNSTNNSIGYGGLQEPVVQVSSIHGDDDVIMMSSFLIHRGCGNANPTQMTAAFAAMSTEVSLIKSESTLS